MAWLAVGVSVSCDRPGYLPGPEIRHRAFGCVCVSVHRNHHTHTPHTTAGWSEPLVVLTFTFSSCSEVLSFDTAGSLRTQSRNAQPTEKVTFRQVTFIFLSNLGILDSNQVAAMNSIYFLRGAGVSSCLVMSDL